MPDAPPEINAILALLSAPNVRFVLVGGLAMVAHGSSHVTQDIDIAYSRELENLSALADVLAPIHPRLRGLPADLPFVLDRRTFQSAINLTLDTDLGPLDLLGEPTGVSSFEAIWSRSLIYELDGISVHVASIEDLIAMKRAAGRPKDTIHILELEALHKILLSYKT